MYSWFIKNGHARNEKDAQAVRKFLEQNLPSNSDEQTGFYERLYMYQSFSWYAFIRLDFLMYYRYAQKWVDLFDEQPLMKRVETGHFIKGLHTLLNAHFDLRNYEKFERTLQQFEAFAATDRVQDHENFRTQAFIYITTAKINQHFMLGTFKLGLSMVPSVEEKMDEYAMFIDNHRVMVLNYKIASLYFGSEDYGTCIDYLQKIINEQVDIRDDLQSYARLLHLMAHFEMGNYEIMEYLTKSVYRFMAKKQHISVLEEEMFKFLRRSFRLSRHKIRAELEDFLQTIKKFENNRFETRALAYLDIISWVEGKVYQKPMATIIHEKYLQRRRKRAATV